MENKLPNDLQHSKSDIVARLAHAFIRFSLSDGENASHTVSSSLASLQIGISKCQKIAEGNSELQEQLNQLTNTIGEGIIALQFYDRVSQRLDHAVRCIKTLESVGLQSNLDNSFDLHALFSQLTMEDERVLFKAIEEGQSIEHAMALATESLHKTVDDRDDNIELF